jgi:hypothetical protein
MEDVQELKSTYKIKQTKIEKHKEDIIKLESELLDIHKKIVANCTHNWEYESPAIYERGYYYCTICGTNK